jgi:hypothetical protein
MNLWMKVAVAAAIAGALGAILATVWVGSKVREETVVANPYEEGLRHTCNLRDGPCTRPLDGGGEVTLELGPRPLRTMRDLAVRVQVTGAAADEVSVRFAMPEMEMGENRSALAASGGGRFDGSAVLVRCPSGRKDWLAEVRLARGGVAAPPVRFRLTVAE